MNSNKQIDEQLDQISRCLSISVINPLNINQEMKKVFLDENYNPQFIYKNDNKNLEKVKNQLKSINPNSSIIGKVLNDIKKRYLLDIKLFQAVGTDDFSEISRQIYGYPDQDLVNKSLKLVKIKIKTERIEYNTNQILSKLRLAFFKYGFSWTVHKKKMIPNAAVRVEEKKLLLKTNSKFSKNFLKRIIVHEIGTHIMRAENGKNQPYKFFGRGLPGYLMTEEGLAVYNEDKNKCLNDKILKIYAGRVLAVHYSLNSSFSKTFIKLKKYFDKETAFKLTLRAKRGIVDTSKKGAFSKDIAYLEGFYKIKGFVKSGGNINDLYYGKIGIEHIPLIEKIPNIVDPKFLPMVRYLDFFTKQFSDVLKNITFLDKIEPIKFKKIKI